MCEYVPAVIVYTSLSPDRAWGPPSPQYSRKGGALYHRGGAAGAWSWPSTSL